MPSSAPDEFDDDFMFMDYDFSLSASEIVESRMSLIMSQSSEYLKCIARAVGSCIASDVYTAEELQLWMLGAVLRKLWYSSNELGIVLCPPTVKENILTTGMSLSLVQTLLVMLLRKWLGALAVVCKKETESVKVLMMLHCLHLFQMGYLS